MRIAGGLLAAALVLGGLIYGTISASSVECTACVVFEGRELCSTVSAAERDTAVSQAVATSCAQLASGVTGSMTCTRTPPRSVTCND